MTSSKLGHSVDSTNQSTAASSTSYSGVQGNPTSAQGASNPAIGGNQVHEDGPAQTIGGSLSQDFTLQGMKAEYKGEDKTVPNPQGSAGEPLENASSGGDRVHKPLQAHETSLPDTPIPSRPQEQTGDNSRNADRKK